MRSYNSCLVDRKTAAADGLELHSSSQVGLAKYGGSKRIGYKFKYKYKYFIKSTNSKHIIGIKQ
jgi:hypothetical protein